MIWLRHVRDGLRCAKTDMMASRRAVLQWMLSYSALAATASEQFTRSTCLFETADAVGGVIKGFSPLYFRDGLTEGGLENGLVFVLREISTLFGVKVAFGFYDDPEEYPNAGAAPYLNATLPDGSTSADGVVAVGRNLVNEIKAETNNIGAALTAVCAHEHGHILQAKYILNDSKLSERLDQLKDRYSIALELYADFICGYFAAFRKKEDPAYPAVEQARVQYFRGDTGAIHSHGTGPQRGNAVYAGFRLAHQADSLNARDVTLAGLDYVTGDQAW